MRKARFYTLTAMDNNVVKKVVDGYLDDNGEIGYYNHCGSGFAWLAIMLDCGHSIAQGSKLKEAASKAAELVKRLKEIDRHTYKGHKKAIELFNEAPIYDSFDKLDWFAKNHWQEFDCFIDLTTNEGQKILKTMKSKKTEEDAIKTWNKRSEEDE